MAGSNPAMLIRIAANIDQLKKNLAEGKAQIESTTAGMQKLAASLDGSKLEQRAHNIAAAINEVGGATKLSDAEARRLLPTLDAWIEKANRIGKEVPADILKTRDALVRTNAEIDKMPSGLTGVKSGLSSMAGMMGITFSAGAVLAFGRQLMATADNIVMVSDRTGLLTDEVQRLTYIADQSGNTLEDLTGAIGQMQNRLASGDSSALAALKGMNIAISDLQAMNPYEQFQAIAAGIEKIPNPANQAQVAMDLFGRTGIAILPTLKSKMKELGDEAPVMSDKTVRALESAGDALNLFKQTATVFAAEAYNWLGKQFDLAVAAIYRYIGSLYESVSGLMSLMAKIPGASKVWPTLATDIKGAATQAQWFKDAATAMVLQTERVTTTARSAGSAMDITAKATAGAAKATRDHGDALKEVAVLTAEQIQVNNLLAKMKEHEKSAVDFAAAAWKAWEKTASDALKNVEKNSVPLHLMTRDLSSFAPMVDAGGAGNLAGVVAPKAGMLERMFGTKADVGNYFKSTFGDLAGMLSSGINGGGIGNALKAYATNVAKDFATTALSFIPGIGPMLSQFAGPMIDGIKKLWGNIFGTAGRDSVKDFVATFGGFDSFHQMLAEKLPADAERLWIALTQGVGRNNPAQAKIIIDQITAALEAQKNKTAEVAAAAESSAATQQAALATISAKYSESISKLESEYKRLSDSVSGEAEEEFMGIVETQQRERMKQIEAEKQAQTIMRDTELAAKQEMFDGMLAAGETVDAELRKIFGAELEIPYSFRARNQPEGLDPVPMAKGGDFLVTKPTLFLAGEAGIERATFSGAGRTDAPGGSSVDTGALLAELRALREDVRNSGGDTHVSIGNEPIDSRVMKVTKRAAATGVIRNRATSGRSY